MSSTARDRTVLGVLIVIALLVPWAVQELTIADWDGWYASLERPPWNPPRWAFPVVWPILYVMMSVAAWLVWRRAGWAGASGALILYGVQFAVNAAWMWIFGGLQSLGGAFWWIVLLWVLIVATIAAFWRHRRAAALLLVPYLVWVTFAGALTWDIWDRNAGRVGM